VRAQVTGTVLKINAREGQDVNAGDILFELDARPYENALRTALADQQRVAVQLTTAKQQVTRYRSLPVGQMISQDQVQQIEDSARTLEAQALAAEAAVANAKVQLSYCTMRAPIAGRLGNFVVHEGDLVRANDTAVLVTINQLRPIYVTFSLAQQHLATVASYQAKGPLEVDAGTTAAEAPAARGQLSFIDNAVDPTTGTIRLKATFSNEETRLWPGQFAAVSITLAKPNVIAIPMSALQTDQQGQHVFVVRANKTAEFRTVTVERTQDDVAVISSGLKEGESVVTDGQLRIIPDRPVQVRPAEVLQTRDEDMVPGRASARPEGKKGKRA
jgi:multidrug efflux system membrane fusion protein